MTTWEVLRQQIAIGGTVSSTTGLAMPGALVTAALQGKKPARYTFTARADGSYYFTDLPNGTYQLTAIAQGATATGKAAVLRDADGTLHIVRLDFVLEA